MHSLISENVSLGEYSQFLPAEIEKKNNITKSF